MFSFKSIEKEAEWVRGVLNKAYSGSMMCGPVFDAYVEGACLHFGIDLKYKDAVKASVSFLAGKPLTDKAGNSAAVVLSGGASTLKKGSQVSLHGVAEKYWAPVEIRDINRRIERDRALYELTLLVLGGQCSGLMLKRTFPWAFLYKFKSVLGVTKRQLSSVDYRDVVLLRFLVLLDRVPVVEKELKAPKQDFDAENKEVEPRSLPDERFTGGVYISEYKATPQCLKHNKGLLKARTGTVRASA